MAATGELSSRITTTPMMDSDPPALRVSWIRWDSGFQPSGLRIGDQIVAVNGTRVARPATQEDLQRMMPALIGQYQENQAWSAAGANAGDAVTLTVRRRHTDQGWETATVKGSLKAAEFYSMPDGQRSLAPGGPAEMEHDGFDDAWGSWYDTKIVQHFTSILDGGWQQVSFNNRFELAQHLPLRDRVDFLQQHYRGAFDDSVKSMWTAVLDCLQGPKYALTDADLKFRRAEQDKVQQATDLTVKGWADVLKSVEAWTIPRFPAVHPIRGNRASVIGKYVASPPLRNSDWIEQAGKTFFGFGSGNDGYYFADAETPAAQAMLLALQRYRRLVSP